MQGIRSYRRDIRYGQVGMRLYKVGMRYSHGQSSCQMLRFPSKKEKENNETIVVSVTMGFEASFNARHCPCLYKYKMQGRYKSVAR